MRTVADDQVSPSLQNLVEMPSSSLKVWNLVRLKALAELEAAHRGIGGTARGRRYATQQINQAYAVLLSSQFQGFCRDLHSECASHFVQSLPLGVIRSTLHNALLQNRKLDHGNPDPGNLGSDFGRFGMSLWSEVNRVDDRNQNRQNRLEELMRWRNAIAHQDFSKVGLVALRLNRVRNWRDACQHLASAFDETMRSYLSSINGVSPW